MNMITRLLLAVAALGALSAATAQNQPRHSGDNFPPPRQADYEIQTPTRLEDYFSKSVSGAISPDNDGFIGRWTILEPISKPNRSNTVFTDSYLNHVLDSVYFKGQMTVIPRDGDKVKVDGKKLMWHSLDSKLYNVKLYRFAAALKKPVYGIIFWAVTVIDCSEDMEGVRLSAGSNSASKWWLDGEEILMLSGDRRMVADNAASRPLTLTKGKHVLRCAVINGPGMSDFCVRFIDNDGYPVKNISISNQ